MSTLLSHDDIFEDETTQANTRQTRRETRRWKAKKVKSNQHSEHSHSKTRIKATGKKRREEAKLTRAERQLQELNTLALPTRYDASLITNHIALQERAEISGEPKILYAKLATLVLRDYSGDGPHRAKVAVTYAVCSEWLTRFEVIEEKKWCYTIPILPRTLKHELIAA